MFEGLIAWKGLATELVLALSPFRDGSSLLGIDVLSEKNWRFGRVCGRMDEVNVDQAILVAEVYSRALSTEDGGMIASYILVDGLTEDECVRAVNFFSAHASLLADVSALAEDCGAEYPALVTIRYSDDAAGYLATAQEYDTLSMLPTDDAVKKEGWDIFCAREGLLRGDAVDDGGELADFDYRALRRKIYANRSHVVEDRSPWLIDEYKELREITANRPEGSEAFIAMADDMEAALAGNVDVEGSFSVVVPTKIVRGTRDGNFTDWVPQTGREIVVAHGLDAIQAARVLTIVEKDPAGFVATSALLSGALQKETLCPPFIVPDSGLNWISTDFSGRRSSQGFERLRDEMNAARAVQTAEVVTLSQEAPQR